MVVFGKKSQNPNSKPISKPDSKEIKEVKYKDDDGFLSEMRREEKIEKDFGIKAEPKIYQKPAKDLSAEEVKENEELDIENNKSSEKTEEVKISNLKNEEVVKKDILRGLFDRVKKASINAPEIIKVKVQKQKDETGKISSSIAAELDANKRRIYTLNGLPPEVVAVAFAKCSRSPEPFDVIAKELNEDLTRKFHERWIVGYGHGSVAEHAVLSIAIENVSVLATKVIEDNRLASFTEKSTRYQVFDKDRYYKPAKIMNSKHADLFVKTCDYLIDTYTEVYPKMLEFVKQKNPRTNDVDEKLYEVRMKAKALDNVRYILPAGILTNLGMTINARQLEYAITKLMSHPLEEMHDIGGEIKEAAIKITPTLVKYAEHSDYIAKSPEQMQQYAKERLRFPAPDDSERISLVEYDREAEEKVVAALLYRNSNYSYKQIRERIKLMKNEEKQVLISVATQGMSKHDRPPREFEHIYYTFDILMDYGAFRDIQRHRICTQTNQEFSANHGYSVPAEIIEAKMEKQFTDCMNKAKAAYDVIAAEFPYEASYLVPLAYKKRLLMTMNLRELCHFIKLRSGKMGHVSYRRLAQQMWDLINEKQPIIAKYIEVDKS